MTATERIPGEQLASRRPAQARDQSASWLSPIEPAAGSSGDAPLIGVLALQGDVLEHVRMLQGAGARPVPVKRADDLDALDGIIIPGGESTTIGKLAEMYGLLDPLRKRLADGMPAFGTCAGAILLSRETLNDDGSPSSQPLLAVMDIVTRRNAFGRQVASFEADLDVAGLDGGALHAVFIRAPWIERVGPGVQALARVPTQAGDKVVVARQGDLLASAFHPELVGDDRLHRLFVTMARARRGASE